MHQGHVTTPPVSLMSHSQMEVFKLQRLVGTHLFINTISLFMSLSPCLTPDKGNKASIEEPVFRNLTHYSTQLFTHIALGAT